MLKSCVYIYFYESFVVPLLIAPHFLHDQILKLYFQELVHLKFQILQHGSSHLYNLYSVLWYSSHA